MGEGDTDVVESVEEAVLRLGVHRERFVDAGGGHLDLEAFHVDHDLGVGVGPGRWSVYLLLGAP